MCLYPRLIQNRKYQPNKKNGGIVPPLPYTVDKKTGEIFDEYRVKLVPVGCGKCMECMKKKAREWSIRLQEDIRTNKNAIFVTLTFNKESLLELSTGIHKLTGYELDNEIAKIAVRRFLERWRKKHKKSVKHWLVTELGHKGTEHIHLHGLIWTKSGKEIENIWKYGYTWDNERTGGYTNEQTIGYITKYIHKIDKNHQYYKPIILTSAGIGKNYINRIDSKKNKYKENKTNETYTTRNGKKIGIPIYWRNKIYTEEEREKLWIEKLNIGERYVLGKKIKETKYNEEYYAWLKIAREKNARLGYGNDEINWDRRIYEHTRRNELHKKNLTKR